MEDAISPKSWRAVPQRDSPADRQNIRANSLCPGPVETPLLAELLADPARRNRRLVHIPMGRFARAEEMANAALFLASDESSFIIGTSFLVDGGISGAYITPE